MTALVISGIAIVAPRLTSATTIIVIQRARYGSRYGSSRIRSELPLIRAGGGAIDAANGSSLLNCRCVLSHLPDPCDINAMAGP